MVARVLLALTLILCGISAASAQSDVPILSGGAGFFSATQGNNTFFQPVVAPVLVVPFGEKWLVESRAHLRGFFSREKGATGPFQRQFIGTLEYLQLDYNANSHLTVTAGRLLTPLCIFNERISAL